MIYILLAIACSSAISVTMKISDRMGQSGYGILCMNYLFASLFSLLPALRCGKMNLMTPAVWVLGIVTGVLFLVTFILDQYSIIRNGAVLTATFMKMGILVPIILSQILWHEKASTVQILGICVAVAAILIMTIPGKKESRILSADEAHLNTENGSSHTEQILWILPVLLIFAGSADSMSKFYTVFGVAEVNEWYMFLTFFTALILCFPLMLRKGERFSLKKAGLGSILGLVNYASTWFLLLAVQELPAYLVYPLVNVGVIAAITLICMTVFGEKLKKRQWVGLVMVLAAVVLLNL